MNDYGHGGGSGDAFGWLALWIILAIIAFFYYTFIDQTPKSTGGELEPPASWCSSIYCD